MRLIVFDCDGTLVDSQATIVTCAQAAFTAEGLAPPPAQAIRRIVGLSLAEAMAVLLPEAGPAQVTRLTRALQQRFGSLQLTLHFHNTRGMGLANVLAAVQGGITRFDGSLGGLGGCPYAPGASGNISSEDAIHMLDAMGYATGIDLPRLLAVARQMPQIVGHDVPGQVAKAGRITDLHPAPASVAEIKETFK